MRETIKAVLAANREFYRAFAARDIGAMEDLWAIRSPVACIHPGWDIMTDRDEVLNSWQQILSHQDEVDIDCRNETPHVMDDVAIVLCNELLNGHVLAVTNMFRREDREWKMIHHQASPMAVSLEEAEEAEISPSTKRLH